jgi:hypothetical protein
MKGGTIMRQAMLLAGVSALPVAAGRRIFGAENISRYIDEFGSMAGHTQRSRGPRTKPRKHSNRLIISKRVRRKHRRAAR